MGILALVLGILGGLSAVMGIVTAVELVAPFYPDLTAMFWMVLGAILLLGCIASALCRTSYE